MAGHRMVMVPQVLQYLAVRDGGVYVDATFGGGACACALLEQADCRVVGIDRDPTAIDGGAALTERYGERLLLHCGRFSRLRAHLQGLGIEAVDGVIFDLGVSSMQLDDGERGFSFMNDGPLDMRMGGARGGGKRAADVVNELSQSALANIFYTLGEERRARRVATLIVQERERKPFQRTRELVQVIERALRGEKRHHHLATKVFLALRIFVNGELDELTAGLAQAVDVLLPQGRLVVVSFHSLEDRIVKHFLRTMSGKDSVGNRHWGRGNQGSQGGHATDGDNVASVVLLHPGAVVPSEEEVSVNPRARSAKLRAAEKMAGRAA
ncbi:MAG: 16S rRNA (cytosine(1402)-N(4))-methyltransferase RsmH [Alphaproteobacteria bacterium GM202ARS2]|nr:16S rRNA (cytosine(1402)-N(4))-methyltransferase RsmH [Alphaproteobacteria bacterium GM202ARS2]